VLTHSHDRCCKLISLFATRILTTLLMLYRVRGAILIGIFLTSIVSWPRPTAVTYFPYTEEGDTLFSYFKKVVSFHTISITGDAITVSRKP
jgi:AGZA family xanthine/uracil permease-like MFS transporter